MKLYDKCVRLLKRFLLNFSKCLPMSFFTFSSRPLGLKFDALVLKFAKHQQKSC